MVCTPLESCPVEPCTESATDASAAKAESTIQQIHKAILLMLHNIDTRPPEKLAKKEKSPVLFKQRTFETIKYRPIPSEEKGGY
jgi:hypothetical protein